MFAMQLLYFEIECFVNVRLRNQLPAYLKRAFTKITRFCIVKMISCIKSQHHYNYKYQVGIELECLLEPDN